MSLGTQSRGLKGIWIPEYLVEQSPAWNILPHEFAREKNSLVPQTTILQSLRSQHPYLPSSGTVHAHQDMRTKLQWHSHTHPERRPPAAHIHRINTKKPPWWISWMWTLGGFLLEMRFVHLSHDHLASGGAAQMAAVHITGSLTRWTLSQLPLSVPAESSPPGARAWTPQWPVDPHNSAVCPRSLESTTASMPPQVRPGAEATLRQLRSSVGLASRQEGGSAALLSLWNFLGPHMDRTEITRNKQQEREHDQQLPR